MEQRYKLIKTIKNISNSAYDGRKKYQTGNVKEFEAGTLFRVDSSPNYMIGGIASENGEYLFVHHFSGFGQITDKDYGSKLAQEILWNSVEVEPETARQYFQTTKMADSDYGWSIIESVWNLPGGKELIKESIELLHQELYSKKEGE